MSKVNPYPERGFWRIDMPTQKKKKARWQRAIYIKLPFAELIVNVPPESKLTKSQVEKITEMIKNSVDQNE